MEAIDRLNRDDYYMRNMMFLDEIDANLVPLVPPVAPIADPGNAKAIAVTQSGVCLLTSGSSAETRTLAVPTRLGMTLDLVHSVDGGGAITITVAAAINQTGNNTIAVQDAGDFLRLVSVRVGANYRWKLIVNDGATLTTV